MRERGRIPLERDSGDEGKKKNMTQLEREMEG